MKSTSFPRATIARLAMLASSCLAGAGCGIGDGVSPSLPPPVARPRVVANRGDVMSPLRLVSLVTADDPLGPRLLSFGDLVPRSRWWSNVGAEYGLGAARPHVSVTGPPITDRILSPHAIHEYIRASIHARPDTTPDGNTLYVLYLPPDVVVDRGSGPNHDCNQFGGYHGLYNLQGDTFAVVQRCAGWPGDLPLDVATVIGSHEIIEAATDPDFQGYHVAPPPSRAPWKSDIGGPFWNAGLDEVGDLCEGTRIREGLFLFQRVWSIHAAATAADPCLPARSSPWNDAYATDPWYPVTSGGIVIPVSIWSEAPQGAWDLRALLDPSASDLFTLHLVEGLHLPGEDTPVSPGQTIHLSVEANPKAKPGAHAVIHLYSYVYDAANRVPVNDDHYHTWIIGIYIP